MNKLKFLFFIGLFVLISLRYGENIRGVFLSVANLSISMYMNFTQSVDDTLNEHFFQKDVIQKLREENKNLQSSAQLLGAFASKLNAILKMNSSGEYDPKVQMVNAISYANLGDNYKVWIDYPDFNASQVYGLIYKGNSAGIVVEKNGHPLALLNGDAKSIYSVFVGDEQIPGVATGKKEHIHIKYIPLWMNPKVGDKVVTSGLDQIFFAGIGVGVVVEIIVEELSKTAVVTPYVQPSATLSYHIIKKP